MGLEVTTSVLKAALLNSTCEVEPNNSGVVDLGNGWTIKKSGSSIVAEHMGVSGGQGATAEPVVTIRWTDGFGVWVSDAENYKNSAKVKDIADGIIQNRQYTSYCINFNGTDYYANCKAYSNNILRDAPTAIISYSTGCAAGTVLCTGAMTWLSGESFAFVGLKNAAKDLAMCAIAPTITVAMWHLASATETSTKYLLSESPLIFGGMLPSWYTSKKAAAIVTTKRIVQVREKLDDLIRYEKALETGALKAPSTIVGEYANKLYAVAESAKEAGDEAIMKKSVYELLGYSNADDAVDGLVGEKYTPLKEFLERQLSTFNSSDEFAQQFQQIAEKSGVADKIAKNLQNRVDEVKKIVEKDLEYKLSLKKQLLCGAVGAVTGTLTYYSIASLTGATGLRYNKLIVTVSNPAPHVVRIYTTSTSTIHNNGTIEVKT